jgi:hypothetical protein
MNLKDRATGAADCESAEEGRAPEFGAYAGVIRQYRQLFSSASARYWAIEIASPFLRRRCPGRLSNSLTAADEVRWRPRGPLESLGMKKTPKRLHGGGRVYKLLETGIQNGIQDKTLVNVRPLSGVVLCFIRGKV